MVSKQSKSKQFFYKQNFKQAYFIHVFCKACNRVKLFHRSNKDVNKTSVQTSSDNLLNPKLSFPPRKLNVPTKFMLFLCLKVTCGTNKVTQRKMEKQTFSLAAMKFWAPRLKNRFSFLMQLTSRMDEIIYSVIKAYRQFI